MAQATADQLKAMPGKAEDARPYFANLMAASAAALAVVAVRKAPHAMSISETFSDQTFKVAKLVRS